MGASGSKEICDTSIMVGRFTDLSGVENTIACSAIGRHRGMYIMGSVSAMYFLVCLIVAIIYLVDGKELNAGEIVFMIYNALGIASAIYLVSVGWDGASYKNRAEVTYTSPFTVTKNEESAQPRLRVKEILKKYGCNTDIDVTSCEIFNIQNKKTVKKLIKRGILTQNYTAPKGTKFIIKKNDGTLQAILPEFAKDLSQLQCRYKNKQMCEDFSDGCYYHIPKGATDKGYCRKKWSWGTGADLMRCDECDNLASGTTAECSFRRTSSIAAVIFIFFSVFALTNAILLPMLFEEDESIDSYKDIMGIVSWILLFVLIMTSILYLTLWGLCPAGSDMGSHGIDDIGLADLFSYPYKAIKTWINEGRA